MEDNENVVSSTETEQVEETTEKVQSESTSKEKTYTRDEVNKMIHAEKEKVRQEVTKKLETEKSEAEKLAKMDTEQKLNYELEQTKRERDDYKNQIESLTLQNEANSYAEKKGLPLGYIKDIDYSHENAESIKEKIDNLVSLRTQDITNSLNEKLKQKSPKAVDSKIEVEDPFIKGFKEYKK